MPASHRGDRLQHIDAQMWVLSVKHAGFRLVRGFTWSGEPVLPGGFVVVQRLQHNVHGECEQAGQEDVEHYIEEKDETCGQTERERLNRLRDSFTNITSQKICRKVNKCWHLISCKSNFIQLQKLNCLLLLIFLAKDPSAVAVLFYLFPEHCSHPQWKKDAKRSLPNRCKKKIACVLSTCCLKAHWARLFPVFL